MRISDWSSDVCSSDLVPKIAAQLYLEELVKQNGGMDCTSDFQDEKLTIEPICNTRRTSWGGSNLSCRFRSNGASVSATMVRHGYAVDYRQHSGLAYARFMTDAADERRGLWGVDYEAMRNLEIGKASGRERVCQSGRIWGVAVSLK